MEVDSTWAALVAVVGASLLYLLIVAAENALATISRTRLRSLDEQDVAGASRALELLEDPSRLRPSLSLLRLLLIVVITSGTLAIVSPSNRSGAVLPVGIWLAILVLRAVAGAVGARWYYRVAPALAPFVSVLILLASPFRALLVWLQQQVAAEQIEDEEALRLDEEERRVLANVMGDQEVVIPEEGREMIYSIISLGQTTVREVMVPRPDIVALRADTGLQEALEIIIEEGHSRIPVYEENIDNIIGVLYAKDLLGYLRDGRTSVPLRDMLRPALFVPASKMADELLQDLQRRKVHLAIAFDEYGGTAGLVTIEDILEEIVGEIQDEYDEEEAAFHRVGEFEAVVSGRFDIDDLNHEMGLELPTDENDTIGGLIYSTLGRVPLLDDEVRFEDAGVTMRVIGMAGRRILKVRLTIDQPSRPAPPEVEEESKAGRGAHSAGEGGSAEVGISRILFW